MAVSHRPPGPWSTIAVVAGVFTLLGVLFSSQVWVDYAYAGLGISWPRALAVALSGWYLWALLTPAIVWLERRAPFARRRWGRAVLVHLPTSLVLSVGMLAAQSAMAGAITGLRRGPFSLLQIYLSLLTYWTIVGVAYSLRQHLAFRDGELQAARLEGQLADARLENLRLQLHPHFLFNTLNAIGALMRENVEAADQMLTRLSDLLRGALETANDQEVPLRRELALLQPYLDIQQVRIGDRLTCTVDIDAAALDVHVPTLTLQPLVENAITHGIADRSGPGRVGILAKVVDDRLRIEVHDDGPGPPPVVSGGGHGLDNVRRRLHALYGPAASLELLRGPERGAIVRVVIPRSKPLVAGGGLRP